MRFYCDTEFKEVGPYQPIDLISLALVTDDDRRLYLINADFDRSQAGDWLTANVLPHLDRTDAPAPVPYADFAEQVAAFVADASAGRKPEFVMWSGSYDFVLLAQVFGTMNTRPAGWPKHFTDLRSWAGRLGNVSVERTQPYEHDALYDALHDRDAFHALAAIEQQRAVRAEHRLRERLLADITRVVRTPSP